MSAAAPARALNFHRVGSGPTVVLLHGVGHHWQAWKPVIDLLSPRFDVLALDVPGFGRSPSLPPSKEPSVPALTTAIVDELRRLGIERPHVAGNSMGGAIALEMALGADAASATAFSPAGFWTEAERRYCQVSLGALGRLPRPLRPAITRLARTGPGRALLFAQLAAEPRRIPPEEAVGTLRDGWAAPSFAPALAAFDGYAVPMADVPADVAVTVAWGARDRLLLARPQSARARQRLPGARHLTLGTGHLPFYDDPAAVARTIEMTAARASLVSDR